MLNKEILKKEIVRLKDMLKKTEDLNNLDLLHKSLEIIYEKISNRKDKSYSNKYNVEQIFKGKTLKTIVKQKKGNGVVFELIRYDDCLEGFVIIYNEFKNGTQTKIDIYVSKENENGRNC